MCKLNHDYEAHVLKEGVISFCGENISNIWYFQNKEHAQASIDTGKRMVPCFACMKEIQDSETSYVIATENVVCIGTPMFATGGV